MTKKMHAWSLAALPLAIGLASFSGSAGAVNFNIGDVEAQLDSQVSVGMSVSTQNADKRFISLSNGGEAAARTSVRAVGVRGAQTPPPEKANRSELDVGARAVGRWGRIGGTAARAPGGARGGGIGLRGD